jgi:hypothetical protein
MDAWNENSLGAASAEDPDPSAISIAITDNMNFFMIIISF